MGRWKPVPKLRDGAGVRKRKDADSLGKALAGMPSPCYYRRAGCQNASEVEKQGRSVCRACAGFLIGQEYPLRRPTRRPIYPAEHQMREALHILPY